MDSSLIQTLFNFITNNIFAIIYIFAIAEIFLVVSIFKLIKRHELVLMDISDNLTKGFKDAPDKDSTFGVHEKIESALDFIKKKTLANDAVKEEFSRNASSISQRPLYNRH